MPKTTRVPTGAYPKPATVHLLDLSLEADRLMAKLPGHRRQTESLAREAGVSVIMMAMEAGDILKEHSADGVVTIHLVRGHADLAADGKTHDLRPGQMVMLQPGVRHDVHAAEQSVVLLTVAEGND